MDKKSNNTVFDIVLAVCEAQDGLCMDEPAERKRLASAITTALRNANVLAHWPESGMPVCKNCDHKGSDHNWTSPPCSRCQNRKLFCPLCAYQRAERRLRGQCQYPNCICSRYMPLTNMPRPVSKVIGRALYKRGGESRRTKR
jgi:hypothetical protein